MNDDWVDEDEYPSDKDIEDFGEDSPYDYDVLSIGYVDGANTPFWTPYRIAILVVVLLIIAALFLPILL